MSAGWGARGAARILPMGETALLLELPDAPATLAVYDVLRHDVERSRQWGVIDIVPAARTVLVSFPGRGASRPDGTPAASRDAIAIWMRKAAERAEHSVEHPRRASGQVAVEIPIRYDGDDLDEAAASIGIDRADLIARHLASEWTAAFVGFAPGFAYLTGDAGLTVPRRPVPRATVPAGAVALAAGYCGIYPRDSPGGWQLIGSTDLILWDTTRPQPALIAPGARVRFVRAG